MDRSNHIRVGIFALIAVFIYCAVSIVMIPKQYIFEDDVYGFNDQMSDFYSRASDTIDVIILGSSHANLSLIPIEMYHQHGITSYNLASSSQTLETSELLLKEALIYQKPKVLIVDISYLFNDKSDYSDMDYNKNYRAIMGVRNYYEKARALLKMCPKEMEYFEYASPMIRFHDRWDKLCADDFFSYMYTYPKYLFGYCLVTYVKPWNEYTFKRPEDVRITTGVDYVKTIEDINEEEKLIRIHSARISENSVKIIKRIKALCDTNNIELICIKAPTAASWSQEKHEQAKTFLVSEGINFIDFNYENTEIVYDWNIDTFDEGLHTNHWGALKTTRYMGDYLAQMGVLDDHRCDSNYSTWDEAYSDYQKYVASITMTDEMLAHEFLYKLALNLSDKAIMISVMDDVAYGWNEKWEKDFQQLGLKNDFTDNYRCSYQSYIEDGVVIYEDYGDVSLLYKDVFVDDYGEHRIELRSEGMKQGNTSIIIVDGIEQQIGKKGFNIVVYDKKMGEIVSSVAIDTYPPVYIFTER